MSRTKRPSGSRAGLLLAFAGLLSAGAADAHRHDRGRGSPGGFDYYLLSLSWSPSYCADAPAAAECGGPRRFGFVVHGLWPQRERDRVEYCEPRARVPDALVRSLADLMPDRRLVLHEWRAHGSCSGLGATGYFGALRRAAGGVAVPAAFRAPYSGRLVAPRVIAGEFLRANPQLRADGLVVACSRGRERRFTELRVCLDRDLSPRSCGASALAGRCRAPLVRVPPMR